MKIRVRKQAFWLFDLRNSGSQSSPLSSCILKIKALTMNQCVKIMIALLDGHLKNQGYGLSIVLYGEFNSS